MGAGPCFKAAWWAAKFLEAGFSKRVIWSFLNVLNVQNGFILDSENPHEQARRTQAGPCAFFRGFFRVRLFD